MPDSPGQQQPNNVGNASMWLGIVSAALVFGIGLCALTGLSNRWIFIAGTPLFICGASSAFLGLLAIILGFSGLAGRDRSRATSIAGLTLGFIGVCLFFFVLSVIRQGG